MTSDSLQESDSVGEGRALDAGEYALSVHVGLESKAVPQFCYANAWHALRELPTLAGGRLVEGWLVRELLDQVQVIEHAWCETASGQLIDPTILFLAEQGQPIFFFPGLRHSWAEASSLSCEQLPIARSAEFGEDGLGHPVYRAAYEAASEKAGTLASFHQPPKPVVVLPCRPAPSLHLVVKIVSSTHFQKGARDAPEL